MPEPLLRVDTVSKRFGGLLAVDRASFDAPAGRITALIGPNGAGKTTLFAIIAGFLRPTAGRVLYDGADVTGAPRHRPHVPDRAAVRRPHRRREHCGRRAPPPRRTRRGARRRRRGRARRRS